MDSDSDGSHISTTPPRDSSPPPPPPRRCIFFSSPKLRSKTKSNITNARPILKPKLSRKKPKPPLENPNPKPPQEVENDPAKHPISPPNLPFQIHRSIPSGDTTNENAFATLLPGSFRSSKVASFSKFQKPIVNFESTVDSGLASASLRSADNDDVQDEKNETFRNTGSLLKPKKHPNLIGVTVCSFPTSSTLPMKRHKGGGEGNYVKLNIGGHGRKQFKFKSKNKNFGSYGGGQKQWDRRKKRNLGHKGEGEGNGLYNEDIVVEINSKWGESLDPHVMELVEEAVTRVRNEASDENLVRLLKVTHGHDSFREGQLEAIKMLLSGESTMLVLPTGAGKSLCYQLPAMVFQGITMVVSPLIALMIDQLRQLPPVIRGGLLCSSQTFEEASETLRLLREGTIKVLFVSPERFLNAEFLSIFSSTCVSLLVVDEAHCISEWSHNFRPSYMRLRASLLCDKLHAERILAMTATATTKTLLDVMHALEIPSKNLIQGIQGRDNLQLSVLISGNRMKDMMTLLKSYPLQEVQSIIIYCKFQSETDLISKYLCDNNILAKSYHSGLSANDRSRVQDLFCSNKIRVVVATVAFGMGLDKRDVGAVMHYSLPESLEEYVQEIGRAGRDGRMSYCHLFFDDATYFKLRSLMHSDGVDEYSVSKLLSHVFNDSLNLEGQISSLVKESSSRKFDIKEEVILTILTQLELGEDQYLCLLPQINVTCTLNFHQTCPTLLATKDVVVSAILKKCERKEGQYIFDIPTIANSLHVQAVDLLNHLQNLKLKGEITYELKDQAYCYTIIKFPKDVCLLAAHLTKWLAEVESCKVRKIDAMFNAAAFAAKECDKLHGCSVVQHTYCMQKKIMEYFSGEESIDFPNKMDQSSPFLRADIKVFLQSNAHAKFTPRAVARILHGLASPAFPSAIWSKIHFWGRYTHVDFKVVMEAAKAELMSIVGKDVL